MRQTYLKREFPAGNPIANALVIVAGVLVLSLAIVLGFFAFVALSAIVLVSAAVIGIRVWWLNRRLRAGGAGGPATAAGGDGRGKVDVIEGEYRVVGKDDEA